MRNLCVFLVLFLDAALVGYLLGRMHERRRCRRILAHPATKCIDIERFGL